MLDLLIKNAMIVDGTGKKAYKGDLGIKNGKIVLDDLDNSAAEIINADGLHVSPGFIDAHSHGDGVYGTEWGQLCKTNQGVTTEVCGQCGSSFYPVNKATLPLLQKLLSVITNSFPENMEKFTDFKTYKDWLATIPLTANTAIITGHSAIRTAVMGYENRKPTPEEMQKMKDLLKECMEEGSVGMSTGLIYPPGVFADTDELIELCKVMAPYDGIYATHMRNESYDVVNSVKEAIEIGEKAGVRVQISHHKAYGKDNWGKSFETMKLVDEAIKRGVKVTLDQYPYEASMTHFNVLIPPQYFDGGIENIVTCLKDPQTRGKIKDEILDRNCTYDNYYWNCGGWDGVFASVLPKTPQFNGMFVSEIAKQLKKDPFDTYFDLVVENNAEGSGIYFSIGEEDMINIVKNPNVVIGSDGIVKALKENGHPRGWATFPHAIRFFHKEKGIFTLEEIIHKMTGLTAERYMLKGKGVIDTGKDADLVVFNYDEFTDTADYKNSNSLADGIRYVIVNGQIVYKDKKLTGKYPGKFISHN